VLSQVENPEKNGAPHATTIVKEKKRVFTLKSKKHQGQKLQKSKDEP